MSGSSHDVVPSPPKEEAPPMPATGSGEPRRKKSKWDDPPLGSITVGGVPVETFRPAPMVPSFGRPDEVMKQVTVPVNVKGRLIGRGGEHINKMRAETQAQITVKHEEGEETCLVSLKGTKATVEHAEVLIFECLKAGRRIVDVPPHCIGETIGHGGCYLQAMSERSGCKLKFVLATEMDPSAEPGKQVCVIQGSPEKINMAEMLLNERVAEVQQQHICKHLKNMKQQHEQQVGGPAQSGWSGTPEVVPPPAALPAVDPAILQAATPQQQEAILKAAAQASYQQQSTPGMDYVLQDINAPQPTGYEAVVQPSLAIQLAQLQAQLQSQVPQTQQDWSQTQTNSSWDDSGWSQSGWESTKQSQGSGYRPPVMPGESYSRGSEGYKAYDYGRVVQAKRWQWGAQKPWSESSRW